MPAPSDYPYIVELKRDVMGKHRLGEFETVVLLAIVHLRGRGYGVSIADEIERRTGQPVSFGAVYATLDRLQKKGLISSELGEPTPERGGKPKRFYRIEAPGERALREAQAVAERMWAGVSPAGAPA
jgi:PadR family transcriptional regulator, regulatory protein PadR